MFAARGEARLPPEARATDAELAMSNVADAAMSHVEEAGSTIAQ